MKKGLTELVFILDMSGSMQPLTEDTIGGYNTLLKEQKEAAGDAVVTTVFFDDRYIVVNDRKPIQEAEYISTKEYRPRGMTAMLDAVGKTISRVGQRLAELAEEERPSLVSVTIITDGKENASEEYTWDAVQAMIKEQREKYSWLFSFIGANIDVEKVSHDLGIDKKMARKYTASKTGTENIYKTLSHTYSGVRAMSVQASLNREEISEYMANNLESIVED